MYTENRRCAWYAKGSGAAQESEDESQLAQSSRQIAGQLTGKNAFQSREAFLEDSKRSEEDGDHRTIESCDA